MPENILSVKIQATAPGVEQTFAGVAAATTKTQVALQKLPGAANQSTQALTNLGRVVQDAPFGFLGIANNLNPLLESFQRLKATTGTTGGALKALGSSLLGAGGLGFALSIVSTALIVFGDKLFASKKKTDEAKEAADKYKEAVKGIFSEVAKEATSVTTLVAVLKSETETRERRLSAIKELQKIQPEIFAGLKLEGHTVVGLDAAYQNYIKNLSTVIAVKLKQVQLEALITKQLEAQGVTLTKTQTDFVNKLKQAGGFTKTEVTETGKIIPLLADVNAKKERENKLLREQQTLQNDIAGIIADISELSKGVKLPDFKDPVKKVKTLTDLLKEINIGLVFDGPPEPQEFKKVIDRIEEGFAKGIIVPLRFEEDPGFLNSDSVKLFDTFQKKIADIGFDILNLPPKIKGLPKVDIFKFNQQDYADVLKALQAIYEKNLQIASVATDLLTPAFDGLFDAIKSGSNALKGFVDGLGNAILGLIQKLITAAILAAAVSTLTGGAAKGGLSFLSAFKGFGGFRALGGPVRKGEPYVVGEAGRELFIPDTGGRIVSNTELAGMGRGRVQAGGMAVEVVGQLLLRGQDLVASLANANRSQGRLT